MFKFAVFIIVLVWLLGYLFGKKRRVVRDAHHALRLITFAALVFVGFSALRDVEVVQSHLLLRIAAMLAWAGVSWFASGLMQTLLMKRKRK